MPVSFKVLLVILIAGGLVVLWRQYQSPMTPQRESMLEPITTTPRSYFEPLVPWTLGGQTVFASIATTDETRALGLSYTSALPPDVVKVFVFATDERWSFWMKGMEYSIDIVWVTATGTIAHIETDVSPATYPKSFTPSISARYVIETVPGLFAGQNLKVGDQVDIAAIIEKNN